MRMAVNLSDNEAERLLAAEKQRKLHEQLTDQLVVAADITPQRFRTKWQTFVTRDRPRGRTQKRLRETAGSICWPTC